MLLRLNRRFKALFEKYISSPSASSTTTYNYGCYNKDYRNIYFYEWGDLMRGAKRFDSINNFIDFLKECKLTLTDEQRNTLEHNSWCYATCVPNRNILMVSEKYLELKAKFEELDASPMECTSLCRF